MYIYIDKNLYRIDGFNGWTVWLERIDFIEGNLTYSEDYTQTNIFKLLKHIFNKLKQLIKQCNN